MGASDYRTILGVRFFVRSAKAATQLALSGGLVVVPAAPALVDLAEDGRYREALVRSDLAITDSGFMVLAWLLLRRERIQRISGLKYLRLLLEEPALKSTKTVLWVVPTPKSRERTLAWLRERGFAVEADDFYVAPMYPRDEIIDPELLALVCARRPAHVVIALGGGVQEKLGLHLRDHTPHRPAIHCIGAALAFLTGEQVAIPRWADALLLGWLFRCISQPRRFVPRYWKARKLLPLLVRYGEQLPELQRASAERLLAD